MTNNMKDLKKYNLFTLITIALVILMPFYVLLKVFFEYQLGLSYTWVLFKEWLVLLLGLSLIYEFYKAKKFPQFEVLDYLILAYFVYGIGVTLWNGLGLSNLFHGGRYDFMFFWVFLLLRHGKQFLHISKKKLIRLFVWSGGISLWLGVFLKVIWEEFLTLFGFNYYVSNWTFQWSVPIYHGVEWSGIRRFQGILDGPNQMAFFLFSYLWAALYFTKKKFEFHHGLILIALFIGIVATFSRSALLGFAWWVGLLVLCNLVILFKKYKKQMLIATAIVIVILGTIWVVFERKIHSIIIRPGSTAAHFERMEIGIQKFIEKPLGYGLATSWPWYRQVHDGPLTKDDEKQFIPESWFVQQLVEWGIIYFTLFCSILFMILIRVYKKSPSFFVACVAIGVMNIFLHIFEATYVSVLLFLFLWLLIPKKYA